MEQVTIKVEDTDDYHDELENACASIQVEMSEIGDPIPVEVIKTEPTESQQGTGFRIVMGMTKSAWESVSQASHNLNTSVDQPSTSKRPHLNTTPSSPDSKNKRNKIVHNLSSETDNATTEQDLVNKSDDELDLHSISSDCSAGSNYGQSDLMFHSDSDYDINSDSNDLRNGDENKQQSNICWSDQPSLPKPPMPFVKKSGLLVPPPKRPFDALEWFLNDELLDKIVTETNKRAAFVCNHQSLSPRSRLKSWKDISRKELLIFLGILYHTGTIRIEKINEYWRSDYLFNIPCFGKFMSRNRFISILTCISFGCEENGGQITKVQSIIDNFNKTMNTIYCPGRDMFIGKPTYIQHGKELPQEKESKNPRDRYKLYMLSEPHGLIINYQVGIATQRVIMDLLRDKINNGHSIYLQKSYISYKIATLLLDRLTYCTGMLDKNSKENPFNNTTDAECLYANNVIAKKWVHQSGNTKKEYYYMTTEFMTPYKLFPDKITSIDQPQALVNCMKCMTSGNTHAQLLKYYPCSGRLLKRFRKVFIHTLQMFMYNAFLLYNMYSGTKKKMVLYDFRLSVIKVMLPEPEVRAAPPAINTKHVMTKITKTRTRVKKEGDQQRIVTETVRKECKMCRMNNKRRSTQYECLACEGAPGFCIDCFCIYHSYKPGDVEALKVGIIS